MMPKTREISTTRDLVSGDHVCWTFASDSEHDATLAAFFAEELEHGERIAYDMRALHSTAVGLAQALHPARLGPAGDDVGFTLTRGGDGVAAISGEIDCAFADQVGSLIEDSAGQITTLDLSRRFADNSGLRALSGAAERIRWTHGKVRIQGASPSFRRLWKILGLDDRVRGSFDDA